jgi:hypothetical protein
MWFIICARFSNHVRKHSSKPSQQETEGKPVESGQRGLRRFIRSVVHFQCESTKSESKKEGSYQGAYCWALPVNKVSNKRGDRVLAHHAADIQLSKKLLKERCPYDKTMVVN